MSSTQIQISLYDPGGVGRTVIICPAVSVIDPPVMVQEKSRNSHFNVTGQFKLFVKVSCEMPFDAVSKKKARTK